MRVKEHRLADRVGAEEVLVEGFRAASLKCLVGFTLEPLEFHFGELRACFHAAAAADAGGERVCVFLLFRRDPWPRALIIRTVDRHPGLHPLQRVKDTTTVDHQIADDGKLAHWLKDNFLRLFFDQTIDQCRASHSRAAIDQHRARTANLFQAVAVPGNRRDLSPVFGGAPCGNPLQHTDHVHVRLVGNGMALPVALTARRILTQDTHTQRLRCLLCSSIRCHRRTISPALPVSRPNHSYSPSWVRSESRCVAEPPPGSPCLGTNQPPAPVVTASAARSFAC